MTLRLQPHGNRSADLFAWEDAVSLMDSSETIHVFRVEVIAVNPSGHG